MATLESLQTKLAALAKKNESLEDKVDSMMKELKSLTKLVRKVRSHQEDPNGDKAKSRAENNGFNRPLVISSLLREFLELGPEDMISRSNVTRRINKYVTDNGLKHPDNGRVIIMDDKLIKLLSPPVGLEITFLNIQKYLSPHYIKTDAVAVTAAAKDVSVVVPPSEPVKRPTVRGKTAKA